MLQLSFALLALAVPFPDAPFVELDYEAALAKAKAQDKLLFVDFTASWCPPCKKMEKETWPHADVVRWLGEHALAIQVDVDEESELAQRFGIRAMPTVVVLRGGEEFDRIIGYRDAPQFLAWAAQVASGRRSSDALLERAKDLASSSDVQARYDLARELLRADQHALALTHYLWLWPATREVPAMSGVRLSFMLKDMAELAKAHAPAKLAFEELLAGLEQRVQSAGVPEHRDWSEWTRLCEYFGHSGRIPAWYEARRDEQGRLFGDVPGELGEQIVADVFAALIAAKRPVDAARLYEDARQHAARMVADHERMKSGSSQLDDEARKSLEGFQERRLTDGLASLFAALLAAERTAEAQDVGALLVRALDTPASRLALVRAGLEVARRPEECFGRWLDEAEAAGGNVGILRRRLARLSEASAAAASEAR